MMKFSSTLEDVLKKANTIREAIQSSPAKQWDPFEIVFAMLMSAANLAKALGVSDEELRLGLDAILDLRKDKQELH
jgi:hypothetical protein